MSEQNRYKISYTYYNKEGWRYRDVVGVWTGDTWQDAIKKWAEDFWRRPAPSVLSERPWEDGQSGEMEIKEILPEDVGSSKDGIVVCVEAAYTEYCAVPPPT